MMRYSFSSIVTIITIWQLLGYAKASKRLILDGEEDVLQAIANLQTELGTMKTEVANLKSESAILKSALSAVTSSNIGSTYIRWGRTICPGNGSELVYHGYMAGSKWNEGGSAKSLCLPSDPMWDHYLDGHNDIATIHGTEIDLQLPVSNALFGKNVNQQDVPCAVCRSSRSAQMMIPARTQCYAGWTEEYGGYVMSAQSSFKSPVDYLCLDKHLEFVAHGGSNDDEHVIHPVEVQCGTLGSLPCPPFVDGRELACVVCTK